MSIGQPGRYYTVRILEEAEKFTSNEELAAQAKLDLLREGPFGFGYLRLAGDR